MFKKLIILVAVIFAAYSVNAQVFEKGDKALNLGINLGMGSETLIPALTASYEVGLFGLGNAGVISLGANVDAAYYYEHIYMAPAFRAAFHAGFIKSDKFDVYAGIMSGLYLYNGSVGYAGRDFIGGRYMFKENMGVFAELPLWSWSASTLSGGICFML